MLSTSMRLTKNAGLTAIQALAIIVLAGTGCSQIKDAQNKMNQMADTTNQVENTSAGIKEDSDALKSDTLGLLALTSNVQYDAESTYYKLRQGNSLQARKDMIIKMNDAQTVEGKIGAAAAYFMAFEFQLWDDKNKDNQTKLDQLYFDAVQEFFRQVREYLPDDYLWNPAVDPTSQSNTSLNLFALSVTMHMKNMLEVNQNPDLKAPNAKPTFVSMFDLLKRGLAKRDARNSGKLKESDLNDWEKEILTDEQAFEYLIRARENFLPVMVVGEVSNIAHKGFLDLAQLWTGFEMTYLDGWIGKPWTPRLKDLNTEQLVTFTKWLDDPEGAIGTRNVLEQLSVDASMNSQVLKIYRNMKIDETRLPPADLIPEDASTPSPVENFKRAVTDILDSPSS